MTWSPLGDQTHPLRSVRLESDVRKLRQLISSFIIYYSHLSADNVSVYVWVTMKCVFSMVFPLTVYNPL